MSNTNQPNAIKEDFKPLQEEPIKKRPLAVINISPDLFFKKLVYSLLLGAVAGISIMLFFGLSWVAMLAISSLVSFCCFEARSWQQNTIKNTKKALRQDPNKWLDQHKGGYRLGYQSNNWLPFMRSCVKIQAYKDYGAYKIGLEEALANRVSRIKP